MVDGVCTTSPLYVYVPVVSSLRLWSCCLLSTSMVVLSPLYVYGRVVSSLDGQSDP